MEDSKKSEQLPQALKRFYLYMLKFHFCISPVFFLTLGAWASKLLYVSVDSSVRLYTLKSAKKSNNSANMPYNDA